MLSVRRIQIYIDDQLDDQLEAEAVATGMSKAAIILDCVAAPYSRSRTMVDPIDALIGAFDGDPLADGERIDDVTYP